MLSSWIAALTNCGSWDFPWTVSFFTLLLPMHVLPEVSVRLSVFYETFCQIEIEIKIWRLYLDFCSNIRYQRCSSIYWIILRLQRGNTGIGCPKRLWMPHPWKCGVNMLIPHPLLRSRNIWVMTGILRFLLLTRNQMALFFPAILAEEEAANFLSF